MCSASFFITFLSPKVATPISMHVPFSLSQIKMSSLLFGMFCWAALVDSVIWLPCLLGLLLLILVHAHTSVLSLILLLFLCIYWSVVEPNFYHVCLCVILSILDMLV
jgi:hypothetical protein